jgi:phosphatidate cytidylyltransferase
VTLSGVHSNQKQEIVRRVASAAALATVAVTATLYSRWSFLVLVLVGDGLVAWEWGRLTRGNGLDGTSLLAAIGAAALVVSLAWGRPEYGLLFIAAAAVAIWFLQGRSGAGTRWALAGLAYAALPAAALVWLRSDEAFGAIAVLYLFAVAWTTDTVSYAAGRLIGGSKLAPRISPHKTWSGFFAGVLSSSLVGLAFAILLKSGSVLGLVLVSLALALACQLGDLLESWVKRRFGAKDASKLIPGHGGLLDRIDGLLLAAVLAGLIALRDPAAPGRALLIW